MQLSRIKDYYAAGAIHEARVCQFALEKSWHLEFLFRPGAIEGESSSLETQRGRIRRFKTADTAIAVANDIGFKLVMVRSA